MLTLTDPASDEVVERFFNLATPKSVAELIGVDYSYLKYLLYVAPAETLYTEFMIPKVTGGRRRILAPGPHLKRLQRRLCHILQNVYQIKNPVHGFVRERSILTNARVHAGQKYLLNLDIEDFFSSINFGRVRGMFMAYPYELNASVATVLAQLCCFSNVLPQGAPTSPIISNMLCAKMDDDLQRMASLEGWKYTRYADDLSFSSTDPVWSYDMVFFRDRLDNVYPVLDIGRLQKRSKLKVEVGYGLRRVIAHNGFNINRKKVRLLVNWQRQEVTGLITNRRANVSRKFVRRVRAMLHDWQKNGLEEASERHFGKHYKRHRNPERREPSFKRVIRGKVEFMGMVRGKQDPLFVRYWNNGGIKRNDSFLRRHTRNGIRLPYEAVA